MVEGAQEFDENVQRIVNAYKVDNGKSFYINKYLSPREKTVLYYLVQGYKREEIGKEIKIS